jgi:hypothetical protein
MELAARRKARERGVWKGASLIARGPPVEW